MNSIILLYIYIYKKIDLDRPIYKLGWGDHKKCIAPQGIQLYIYIMCINNIMFFIDFQGNEHIEGIVLLRQLLLEMVIFMY